MTTSFKILASMTICAAMTAGTAFARDNDHDRDKAESSHHYAVRDRDRHEARERHEVRERRESREARERREARARELRRHHAQNSMFGKNGQPSGWSQGHKTGWSNCNVPPGQAKPAGCAPSHSPRPVRDRDHDGDRR
jgi:hypothetical protein